MIRQGIDLLQSVPEQREKTPIKADVFMKEIDYFDVVSIGIPATKRF